MSALSDKHNAEIYRLGQIIEINARLGGIFLNADQCRALVRDVLDNYKPVGVWSEIPDGQSLQSGSFAFTRPGSWRRWDIRIGSKIFTYRAFQHEQNKRDPGYEAHVLRSVRQRIGVAIADWATGLADQPGDEPVETREIDKQ